MRKHLRPGSDAVSHGQMRAALQNSHLKAGGNEDKTVLAQKHCKDNIDVFQRLSEQGQITGSAVVLNIIINVQDNDTTLCARVAQI